MGRAVIDPHHIYPSRMCYKEEGRRFERNKDKLAWQFHNLDPFVIIVTRTDHDWIEKYITPPPLPSREQMREAIAKHKPFDRLESHKIYSLEEAVEIMLSYGAKKKAEIPRSYPGLPEFLRKTEKSRTIGQAVSQTSTRFAPAKWG